MKRKEVEDVMGGKDAWANVDKTDGKFLTIHISLRARFFNEQSILTVFLASAMSSGRMRWCPGFLLSGSNQKCGRTNDNILQG